MRYMYDAVTARNILKADRSPQMVAGYADTIKIPQWTDADWALFPNAVKVKIVKKASSNWGDVLDVEPGDATPTQAPGWVAMRRRAGADPTIYCNLSTWPSVQNAFRNSGIPEPWYWIARYDGDPTIPDSWVRQRCVAKQYHGNDSQGFDKSSVLDYWPGVDTKETPDMDANQAQQLEEIHQYLFEAVQSKVPGSQARYHMRDYVLFNNANLFNMTTVTLPLLLSTLEKVTSDTDITADNLKTWIADAVTQHLKVTGTFEVTGE